MLSIPLLLATLSSPGSTVDAAPAATVDGQYLEVRTCDVYTGPCFANAEVNEVGKEATLAWKFDSGEIDGVALAGKSVVAVIRSANTLGKPHCELKALETAIFVDATADLPQQAALASFAKRQLGAHATAVPLTKAASIRLATGCCDEKGCASLRVGDEIAVDTRCVCAHDKHCGNETLFYPPLTAATDVTPAVATEHTVKSDLFQVRFSDRESRGAITGRFRLAADDTKPAKGDAAKSGAPIEAKDEAKDETKQDAAKKEGEPAFLLKAIESQELPKEIPEPFARLLDKKGLRLSAAGDKPYYDLWLRAEVPLLADAKPSLSIKYAQIPVGTVVGVTRAYGDSADYKDNPIHPGFYAMRYGIQPEDGDHMGTAPNRDFFILTSFKDDLDPAPIADMEKLGELSILAGDDHPLTCQTRPLEGEAKASPSLVHDAKNKLWIVDLTLTGRAEGAPADRAAEKIRVGLVLVGFSEDV